MAFPSPQPHDDVVVAVLVMDALVGFAGCQRCEWALADGSTSCQHN